MAEPFIHDEAYKKKVFNIVSEAMVLGLMDPDTRVSVWRSGDIVDVFLTITAVLLADSGVVDTPTKTREFCGEWGRKFQRRIGEAKRQFAAGNTPFTESIRIEGELN